MNKTVWMLGVFVGLAGISTIAWHLARSPRAPALAVASAGESPEADSGGAQVDAQRRVIDRRSTEADSNPRAADLPAGETPAHEAIEALLALAQQGRADAMRELSLRLVQCARTDTLSDDGALRDRTLKRFYWNNGREPSSDGEISEVAADVDQLSRRRDECRPVDRDLLSHRIDWLEKAALAGDIRAKMDYARWGLQDMDREDILMHPAEVQRRREMAAGFLQQALAGGQCEVLALLADAYGGTRGLMDWIVQPDPVLAVVYSQASGLRNPVLSTGQGAVPPPLTADLTSDRLAAARRQGDSLYARYCSDGQ